MNHVIESPPRTIMQVFKMLPEGTLAEVIENVLYMSPAPNPYHQRILVRLSSRLDNYILENELGEILIAPVDLYLDETANAVQPDILFFSKNNPLVVNKSGLHGVPDLIIEILSPGNKEHDLVKKKLLYEKFGVKEYWIIDPETKIASGYTLKEITYHPIGEHKNKIDSPLLGSIFEY